MSAPAKRPKPLRRAVLFSALAIVPAYIGWAVGVVLLSLSLCGNDLDLSSGSLSSDCSGGGGAVAVVVWSILCVAAVLSPIGVALWRQRSGSMGR